MSLREKINDIKNRIGKKSQKNSDVKNWITGVVTFFTMASACPNFASAQNVKDDKKKPDIEASVGARNLSSIYIDNNGYGFYNDLGLSAKVGIEKNGWGADFSATELLILRANDKGYNFTPVNTEFMLALSKELANNKGEFSLILGRENTMASDQLFNGVNLTATSVEDRYMGLFGNGTDRMTFSYRNSKGMYVELGAICKKGDGLLVIPNPKEADLWGRVSARVLDKNNMNLTLTTAARVGEQDEVHGNIAFLKDKNNHGWGISVGGKYDIVNHDGAAFVAFNKEFKNEAELILQTLYDGKEIVVNGALGKNGLQMFTEVAVKTDKTVTGNDKVTGQLGLSYVLNQGKKWSNNK